MSTFRHSPANRLCRYSDCINARDDNSNVCPHHEAEDDGCASICKGPHDAGLDDDKCRCWITCAKCRDWLGLDPLADDDFDTTVGEVA